MSPGRLISFCNHNHWRVQGGALGAEAPRKRGPGKKRRKKKEKERRKEKETEKERKKESH